MFKNNVTEVSIYEKINLSNKIVIITSFVMFFFYSIYPKIKFLLRQILKKKNKQ